MLKVIRRCGWFLTAAGGGWLVGCGKPQTTAVPTAPPTVSVSQPVQRDIVESIEYTGNTDAVASVDIRAQVTGYLQSIDFVPRQRVKKDDVLFKIDPRPYQTQVDIEKANLNVANAQLKLVEAKLLRMEQALKSNAISEVEVIEQRASKEKTEADIEGVKASLEKAQLNLGYTSVRAPFDGQMSRNLVELGALIEPGSTLMATIVDDSSVYAYFNVSEADVLKLQRKYPRPPGAAQTQPTNPARVELGLMGEAGYPHIGYLDYVAPEVNRSTGTIEVRAKFPNADGVLLGGLFARIRLPISAPAPALVVTERAIGLDQGQRYVLVVNEKNVVEYRPVQVGLLEQGLRVIRQGLKADDWVIVNGLQRVRPGVEVAPQRVAMDSFAEPSAPTASSPATKTAN